jgi:hypothetical protein
MFPDRKQQEEIGNKNKILSQSPLNTPKTDRDWYTQIDKVFIQEKKFAVSQFKLKALNSEINYNFFLENIKLDGIQRLSENTKYNLSITTTLNLNESSVFQSPPEGSPEGMRLSQKVLRYLKKQCVPSGGSVNVLILYENLRNNPLLFFELLQNNNNYDDAPSDLQILTQYIKLFWRSYLLNNKQENKKFFSTEEWNFIQKNSAFVNLKDANQTLVYRETVIQSLIEKSETFFIPKKKKETIVFNKNITESVQLFTDSEAYEAFKNDKLYQSKYLTFSSEAEKLVNKDLGIFSKLYHYFTGNKIKNNELSSFDLYSFFETLKEKLQSYLIPALIVQLPDSPNYSMFTRENIVHNTIL